MTAKLEKFRLEDPNLKYHFYCYTLGKEEICVNLAKDFKTKIIINQERWDRLDAIGIAEDYFIIEE